MIHVVIFICPGARSKLIGPFIRSALSRARIELYVLGT